MNYKSAIYCAHGHGDGTPHGQACACPIDCSCREHLCPKLIPSALDCPHANELPLQCGCDSSCYCRTLGACRFRQGMTIPHAAVAAPLTVVSVHPDPYAIEVEGASESPQTGLNVDSLFSSTQTPGRAVAASESPLLHPQAHSAPPVFLGIDPGLSGAIAVIQGDAVSLFDVPTRKATRGEAYLPGAMADLLRPYAPHPLKSRSTVFCVLEQVEATRAGGEARAVGNVNSALKCGLGGGLWEGILAAYHIPYEVVRAVVWKKTFSLAGQDKPASRARACELFPAIRAELTRRRPDYAEALLLAEFGRRRVNR